jgi:two-component system NarL family sensor kinase
MPSRRELEILTSIAEAFNSAPTVGEALERTLDVVGRQLGLSTGWVWLVDAASGHIYSAAARNLPPYLQEPVRMTGASCWCIEEFRRGALTPRNVDVMECSRLRPAVRAQQTELTSGVAHHASVPLLFQDKPLGIMNVTAPGMRRLRRDELRLLGLIGLQLGVAVERARLAEETSELARADERTRLAREIHDTLAQDLTAITLQIETALAHVDDDPRRARERMERALATARSSLEEARRSVMSLRGEPLSGKPLPQALAALVREFTSESGIRVSLVTEAHCALPPAAEGELYRIAQQSLDNVRQHAHARHVTIELTCGTRRVTLTIADDGQGFNVRRVPPARHGVAGMRERARLLGGALRITSRPGAGTRIAVTLPRSEV